MPYLESSKLVVTFDDLIVVAALMTPTGNQFGAEAPEREKDLVGQVLMYVNHKLGSQLKGVYLRTVHTRLEQRSTRETGDSMRVFSRKLIDDLGR